MSTFLKALRRSHVDTAVRHVRITVDDEPRFLHRVTLLNTTFAAMLTGNTLLRVLSADYARGCLDFLVEGPTTIKPPVRHSQGKVHILIEPISVKG